MGGVTTGFGPRLRRGLPFKSTKGGSGGTVAAVAAVAAVATEGRHSVRSVDAKSSLIEAVNFASAIAAAGIGITYAKNPESSGATGG